MRYVPCTIALCAICSLLLPVTAQGQTGARLDPGSPAGVEYELPLEQARKNAAGGGGDGPGSEGDRAGGGGDGSLFGAGIVPVKRSVDAQDGGDGDGMQGGLASEGASDGGGRDAQEGSSGGTIKRSALGAPDEDEGSAALRIAGIALAVLLVGGLLGLALRRGLRQPAE